MTNMDEEDIVQSIQRWRDQLSAVERSPTDRVECWYGPSGDHRETCICGGRGTFSKQEAVEECHLMLEALSK